MECFWCYGSPDDDLSASLPVLSIFGTNDGVTTLDEIDTSKLTLPATTFTSSFKGRITHSLGITVTRPRILRPILLKKISISFIPVRLRTSSIRHWSRERHLNTLGLKKPANLDLIVDRQTLVGGSKMEA